MLMKRRNQYTGPAGNRSQAKIQKFLKDAKDDLEQDNYDELLKILSKYSAETLCSSIHFTIYALS